MFGYRMGGTQIGEAECLLSTQSGPSKHKFSIADVHICAFLLMLSLVIRLSLESAFILHLHKRITEQNTSATQPETDCEHS